MTLDKQDAKSQKNHKSKKKFKFNSFFHEFLTSCHPRQWTLRTRLLYLPSFLIILFVILLLFYLNQAFTVQTKNAAKNQLFLLSKCVTGNIDDHKNKLLTESLLTADDPDILAAFASEDREKLNSLLLINMERRLKYSKDTQRFYYHFYHPPAVSFYQDNLTKRWGEDLSQSKSLVVKVNEELQSYSGLERDDDGITIIAASPVILHDKHMGAVEVGVSLKNIFDDMELAVPFGMLVVTDSGRVKPATEAPEQAQDLNRIKILLRKGHVNSEVIGQEMSSLSESLQSNKVLYKIIELNGFDDSSLAKIIIVYDAASDIGIYHKDIFSFLLIAGSFLLILILYSNLVNIGSFFSLLKKIVIGSFSNDFAKRFESDHIHCLHVLNCRHGECPVHQNPNLVCYLETGSLAISPKWRNTCVFLNKYSDCTLCPVYSRRIRDELNEMRNVVNTIMHLWSDFLDKIETLLADADVLRSFAYQHKKLSLDNVSSFLEQMAKVTNYGRDLQGARNEDEVYKQLAFVLEKEFSVDFYVLFNVNRRDNKMNILLDNIDNEPLCIKEVSVNADFCRAKRLGEVVYSYNNNMLCPYFNIDHQEYHRYCLPMVMGGGVGVVLSFMAPKKQLDARRKQITLMRKYLDESAPILNSLRLLSLLKNQTLKDPLTHCYNRRFLDDYIKQYEPLAKRNNSEIGLLMLDIDYFKLVNDEYGHQAGDQILIEVVAIIRDQIRESDLLVRFGGEEFLIILLEMKDGLTADNVAEKIRKAVEQHHFKLHDGQVLQKRVSIGVGIFPEDANSINQTIKYADVALYEAKQTGRNRVVRFKPEMWQEWDHAVKIDKDLLLESSHDIPVEKKIEKGD